jgi:hypothetical protein
MIELNPKQQEDFDAMLIKFASSDVLYDEKEFLKSWNDQNVDEEQIAEIAKEYVWEAYEHLDGYDIVSKIVDIKDVMEHRLKDYLEWLVKENEITINTA